MGVRRSNSACLLIVLIIIVISILSQPPRILSDIDYPDCIYVQGEIGNGIKISISDRISYPPEAVLEMVSITISNGSFSEKIRHNSFKNMEKSNNVYSADVNTIFSEQQQAVLRCGNQILSKGLLNPQYTQDKGTKIQIGQNEIIYSNICVQNETMVVFSDNEVSIKRQTASKEDSYSFDVIPTQFQPYSFDFNQFSIIMSHAETTIASVIYDFVLILEIYLSKLPKSAKPIIVFNKNSEIHSELAKFYASSASFKYSNQFCSKEAVLLPSFASTLKNSDLLFNHPSDISDILRSRFRTRHKEPSYTVSDQHLRDHKVDFVLGDTQSVVDIAHILAEARIFICHSLQVCFNSYLMGTNTTLIQVGSSSFKPYASAKGMSYHHLDSDEELSQILLKE